MADHGVIEAGWMRKFLPIWGGQLISLLGSGLVQFALVWYLTQKTGSAVVLTTATLVALLPEVFILPFAGALVDRWNRRWVMVLADSAIALVTFSLAVLFFFDAVQLWHIYAVLFLRALGGIFHWPAMQASTSLMVPERHLSRIAGLNQGLRGALNIIAPPLGALLMTVLPLYGVIAVDVVTACFAVIPLLFIAVPQPRTVSSDPVTPRAILADVRFGFRYLGKWKGAYYLIGMATLLNFVLSPSGTLMPLLITRYFSGGVWHLSLIESAMGIGIVIGGLVMGVWGGFKKKVLTTLAGMAGLGVGVLIAGLVPAGWFAAAVVGWAITGIMTPITNAPIMALFQSRIPAEMQGRVFSTVGSLAAAMMPLSMLVAAPIAELMGVRAWFLLGGGLCILIGLAGFGVPDIVQLEAQQDPLVEPASV